MKKAPKIIVVLGPTATGKSDLAVTIAKKFNGEIISADSRQVYTGLDIGTGKVTRREMQGVPHHLLDVVSPKKQYTPAQWKNAAERVAQDIIAQGKLPIICGGTGQYIDALVYNISFPEVPPDKKLRARLEKLSSEKLFAMLKKLEPIRAENIDAKNPRRLIRAIEIATALGHVPHLETGRPSDYDMLFIGLDMDDEMLRARIKARLLARLRQGMVAEAKRLYAQGVSWKRMEEFGLEYRYLSQYLCGKISRAELVEQLNFAIWHYAKRQRTWFKRNKDVQWLPADKKEASVTKAEGLVKKFLK
ncbi:MAG: tRNA (adenosine(37)-N6)-dimethylallyltransferase MiaA [Candidatus Yonathbacteria bacterium RIFCSPHIGHO2_01_FULL_51_10]|uniref:tRNA dimethylallyltransferase n=1 Tax=Candidatus Yonathbacteria bacterium RIFCSPHIGHO2_01_FULL_51_10 TaxID=1802723 RepID=A0A1G2S9D7_9BACT|nr:MAG: tRNA (adenosine(37)-N6)-dimethylallyltransferase MiaA [Candidatus Yonathbacteria bacterium RIFCSPHIGHO2_01_FULL_51_10]